MNLLEESLYKSKTAFHACENAAEILKKNGFTELKETKSWNLKKNGKYFVKKR